MCDKGFRGSNERKIDMKILCLPAHISDFGHVMMKADEFSKVYSIQTSKSSTHDEFTVQTLKHAGNEYGNAIKHYSVI